MIKYNYLLTFTYYVLILNSSSDGYTNPVTRYLLNDKEIYDFGGEKDLMFSHYLSYHICVLQRVHDSDNKIEFPNTLHNLKLS